MQGSWCHNDRCRLSFPLQEGAGLSLIHIFETLAAKLILADGVRAGDTILIDVKDGKLSASAVQKNA